MHPTAQYLEALALAALASLGLAAAWGIIQVMLGLLDAGRVGPGIKTR